MGKARHRDWPSPRGNFGAVPRDLSWGRNARRTSEPAQLEILVVLALLSTLTWGLHIATTRRYWSELVAATVGSPPTRSESAQSSPGPGVMSLTRAAVRTRFHVWAFHPYRAIDLMVPLPYSVQELSELRSLVDLDPQEHKDAVPP